MLRAFVLAMLLCFVQRPDAAQTLSVLHIRVSLVEAGERSPVPRHSLLISDNPATAAPRLVATGLDGTVDVRLRPGNYTVESDRPVRFHGKSYQWTQTVEVVEGREAVLELTRDNAEVVEGLPEATAPGTLLDADPALVLPRWEDSVVEVWTPYSHATGFLVDSRGIVATSQRAIGAATSLEVQLTPTKKLPGQVVLTDPANDVAAIRVDPAAISALKPLPLPCAQTTKSPLSAGQEIFAIVAPLRHEKDLVSGRISRIESGVPVSDLLVDPGGAGGPVFSASLDLVGLTAIVDEPDDSRRGDVLIVSVEHACPVLAAALKKVNGTAPPAGTSLPVEPPRPFPVDALKELVQRRAGSLNPYQIASSSFDVAFITPVLIYGAQYQAQQVTNRARDRNKGAGNVAPDPPFVRPQMDFGNWSNYVRDALPVLLVRVTPRMVEGFWTTIARGAARTQGVDVPPIKKFKSGFSRLRAFCGDAEATPIHPFKLEHRVSDTTTVDEGLYVFDPGALGPDCGTVKLVLYSDKGPDKGETRIVDAAIIQQIWDDFSPYRALIR